MKNKYFTMLIVLLLTNTIMTAQNKTSQLKNKNNLKQEIEMSSSDLDTLIKKHLTIWNERNAEIRDASGKEVYDKNVQVIAPFAVTNGYEELSYLIGALLTKYSDYAKTLSKPIDEHHGVVRVSWMIGNADKPIATGQDVIVVENGKIKTLYVFNDGRKNSN